MKLEGRGVGKQPFSVYSCWIHGQERRGGTLYPLIDPSTGEIFARATAADRTLVDEAFASALEGWIGWRSTSAHRRAELLHAIAGGIREECEPLASLLSIEVGKPLPSARDEVLSFCTLLDFFAEESLRLSGTIPLMGYHQEQVLVVREPVGVVAAITPFNYPLSTLACKMGPALAVGCTMVVKPDEHTPLSTLRVGELAFRAGLPPGVVNVVTGPGTETGRLLVEHEAPRLITFTGSTEVGKEIQAGSARYVRKTVLELGGSCPAIVCKDAPWEELVPQLVRQSFKNTGQYCYRTSRIYVAEEIYEGFLTRFVDLAGSLRVGPPSEPGVDLGPLNNREMLYRVCRQIEQAVKEGARVECGGKPLERPEGGFYYPPTVLTEVSSSMSILQEEVFGPVVLLSSLDDMSKAVEEANATRYGLAAYLFTRDLATAMEWAARLEVGSVWINRIHQSYAEAPFGGRKESGLGREKSRFGLEEYTELKTIYLCY